MLKSLLAAVVTLALLTCPFPARAYEKTILKVGMGDPIDSEMGAIGTRFKEVVEARSEGKVEVQLFPSGQLGDETEMIQNVRAGNLRCGHRQYGPVREKTRHPHHALPF